MLQPCCSFKLFFKEYAWKLKLLRCFSSTLLPTFKINAQWVWIFFDTLTTVKLKPSVRVLYCILLLCIHIACPVSYGVELLTFCTFALPNQ